MERYQSIRRKLSMGDPVELAGDGVFLNHQERYEATDEFLSIWRGLLAGKIVNFTGKHLKIEDGELLFPSVQQPYPPIYFGGSSPTGQEVAVKHADVYLTWGEPVEQVKEKIASVRARAAKEGREVTFGIRLHVIVREMSEKAWAAAERLISHVDEETIRKAQETFSRYDSHGQQWMADLHKGERTDWKSARIFGQALVWFEV